MDNKQIFASVKAGFTLQQTSLHKWCNENGLKRQNARRALLGEWKGKRGLEIRQLLIEASGAQCRNSVNEVATKSCDINTLVATDM